MKTLLWDNPVTIDYLEKELHKGSVILAEGDTVLGLLADISEEGYAHLDYIKHRSKKPYLILVGSIKKAFNFIEYERGQYFQIEKLMNSCWPGPVTLIFKAKAGFVFSGKMIDNTVAIRVPDHAWLLNLLARFDALFSTSANSSGQPVPESLEQVDSHIMNSVSCVVVNDFNKKAQAVLPSTIIDCTGNQLVLVRKGAFDIGQLESMMNVKKNV
jgi:L-threonylcarbamoyladenylate synthase